MVKLASGQEGSKTTHLNPWADIRVEKYMPDVFSYAGTRCDYSYFSETFFQNDNSRFGKFQNAFSSFVSVKNACVFTSAVFIATLFYGFHFFKSSSKGFSFLYPGDIYNISYLDK